MAVVDPYFHYHKPQEFVKYKLDEERYQNNGIVKHFEYDAIITGSSMTQCFRPSQLNELFGVDSVKVPYSGGSYKEVNDNLEIAIRYNPDICMVVRGLDANQFFDDKDKINYDNCPTYLYDDMVWNDASYLFNKEVFLCRLYKIHLEFYNKATININMCKLFQHTLHKRKYNIQMTSKSKTFP